MRLKTLLGSAALLLGSAAAHAGGLGVIGTGGVHTAKAYYYDAEGEQGIDSQIRPSGGLGLEGMLGAKDDRIVGLFRVYVLADAPVAMPDTGDLDASEVTTPPYDTLGWAQKGVMSVGVQWTVYGDPEGFQLVVDSMVGTGFMTPDSLEFLLVDVGPGVTYALGDKLQLTGTLSATGRYRKGLSLGGNAYAGVRFLFD